MPICHPFLASFFDRFWFHFGFILRPSNPFKSSPRCRESVIFEESPVEVDMDLLSDIGANLIPCFNTKTITILSENDLQGHHIPDLSLGVLPVPQGDPQDNPKGIKTALGRVKKAPRRPLDVPRTPQDRTRTPQAPSRPAHVHL